MKKLLTLLRIGLLKNYLRNYFHSMIKNYLPTPLKYKTFKFRQTKKYINFIKPFNDVQNSWVKKHDLEFQEVRPFTINMNGLVTYCFVSKDGKLLLNVKDRYENYLVSDKIIS